MEYEYGVFNFYIFRDETLNKFEGLRKKTGGKLSIAKPDETSEMVALYTRRWLNANDQRGIDILYVNSCVSQNRESLRNDFD